jgi:hypothetical protein
VDEATIRVLYGIADEVVRTLNAQARDPNRRNPNLLDITYTVACCVRKELKEHLPEFAAEREAEREERLRNL